MPSGSVMNLSVITEISRHKDSGAIITFRRNRLGLPKIKIKYGPFHVLTRRIDTDIETFEQVKNICSSSASRKKSNM